MSAPRITVAVRDKEGKAHLFSVQHESICNHEQARYITMKEFPDARVILASVEVA